MHEQHTKDGWTGHDGRDRVAGLGGSGSHRHHGADAHRGGDEEEDEELLLLLAACDSNACIPIIYSGECVRCAKEG
jgi:hypothetical protein